MATETNTTEAGKHDSLIGRLFAAGAHFGFTKRRRHPTVAPYLFGSKDGSDIFDLEKTAGLLTDAAEIMEHAGAERKTVLFVGTKDEIAKLVKGVAERIAMPYVANRWIGGMLTNFAEIQKRVKRLLELTSQGESGELERKYTKKERVMIGRELQKLSFNFGGIKAMEKLPDLIVIVDPRHEETAVREARALGIKTLGISSTDGDISKVSCPVLLNDALQSSVRLALDELAAAYEAGVAKQSTEQTAPAAASAKIEATA
jgi:small subunit ribosomal protein S2